MSAKRAAELPLGATFKARRSTRISSRAVAGTSANSSAKPLSGAEIPVKQDPTAAEIKVEYEGTVHATTLPVLDHENGKSPFFLKKEDPGAPNSEVSAPVKHEDTSQILPPTPASESPTLTPRNGTFYSQIGSNVFSPVSPDDVTPEQPKKWDLVYNEIVKMRALITTPVDSFGCERLPDTLTPGMSSVDPKTYRFQLLISLMLSAQTKDETNFAAMKTLQDYFVNKGYPGICLEAVLASTDAEIDQCIAKVGFHRKKAVYIKKSCDLLHEKFGGEIPKTIGEIVTLPGVGPKMGHLVLQNGWSINSGIGVDVHLHRLAQMWGWVPKSNNPESTRNALEGWLPRKYWADINPLLVGFGQTVCAPAANNCDVCFLGKGLCKGANRKLVNAEITEKRLQKLAKQRGDLSGLVKVKMEGGGR